MYVHAPVVSHHRPQPALAPRSRPQQSSEPEDRLTHHDVLAFSAPRILSILGGALTGASLAASQGDTLTMLAAAAIGGVVGATLSDHADAMAARARPQHGPNLYVPQEIKTAAKARQVGALVSVAVSGGLALLDPTLGALSLLGTSLLVPAYLQDRAMSQLTSRL